MFVDFLGADVAGLEGVKMARSLHGALAAKSKNLDPETKEDGGRRNLKKGTVRFFSTR